MFKKFIAGVLSTTFIFSSVMLNQVIDVPEKLTASAMYIDSDFNIVDCDGVTKSGFESNLINYDNLTENGTILKMTDFFETSILPDALKYKNVAEIEQLGKNIISFVTSDGYIFVYGSGNMYNFEVSPFKNVENIKEAFFYDDSENGICITSIGNHLFHGAEKLETVHISVNLESFGDYSFYNCVNFDNFTFIGYKKTDQLCFQNKTTYIGAYAFSHCIKIHEIAFSCGNQTQIGDHAFEYCWPEEIGMLWDLGNIGNNIFYKCKRIHKITLPSLSDKYLTILKSIPDTIDTIHIDEYAPNIPDDAFSGRTVLNYVYLYQNIAGIGNNAFAGCTNLQYVYAYTWNSDPPYRYEKDFWKSIYIGTGNEPLYKVIPYSIIVHHPNNVTAKRGDKVSFKVDVTGTKYTYQWQYSYDNGETWKDTSASTGKTPYLNFNLTGSQKSRLYRCVITDVYGRTMITNPASLTVISSPIEITSQPEDVTASKGDYISYNVEATGDGLTYQWQYSYDNGASWKDTSASSGKTANLSFNLNGSQKSRLYRCVITDQYGETKTSNSAKLTVVSAQ